MRRSDKEVNDRLIEVNREIRKIDRKYEDGEYIEDEYAYERDVEKRAELQIEGKTLTWVMTDF